MIVSSINLGCTKNLVDTQFLLGKVFSFENSDLQYCPDPFDEAVEIVFLNTCGFIASGRKETMEVLSNLLEVGKKIYLLGCTVQYFQKLIADEDKAKEIGDETHIERQERKKLITKKNVFLLSWEDAKNLSLSQLEEGYSSTRFNEFEHQDSVRFFSNIDLGFEYIKIAEGCNNQCAFCAIPKIRGKQKSLTIDQVGNQVQDALDQGAKEIILISQDSTRYGVDIYGQSELLTLLRDLEMMPQDFGFRVLYMYPDLLTYEWMEGLLELNKFIPYFDLPLQHINFKLLKKMGRFSDIESIREMLKFIRENFENAYIRTNFIVGFPGETAEMVQELADFIGEGWFDNIAFFEYHDEPLAPAYKFKDKISDEEIRNRFEFLNGVWKDIFDLQEKERKKEKQVGFVEEITYPSNSPKIGEKLKIIVRPWLHAPEIDSVDEISEKNIVEILDAEELELGSLVEYKC